MKKISNDTKLTIQVILSIALIIAGLVLLFIGFFYPPQGEIHDSILVAYGEVSTFSGALLGIDYSYRYKMYVEDSRHRRHHAERDIEAEEEINEEE